MARERAAAASAERRRLGELLAIERRLWRRGVRRIAGVDEAGLGPLAGPLFAAAVILPPGPGIPGADDSKRLGPAERERLDREIRARAVALSVVEVGVAEIDARNVYHAGLEAMRRAVLGLAEPPEHVLSDARRIPGLGRLPVDAHVKGDARCHAIACASILAKVARDRRMVELALLHPGYGLERNRGYGTPEHLEAIRRLGPSPIHRRSYPALARLLLRSSPRAEALRRDIERARHRTALDRAHAAVIAGAWSLAPAEVDALLDFAAARRRHLR